MNTMSPFLTFPNPDQRDRPLTSPLGYMPGFPCGTATHGWIDFSLHWEESRGRISVASTEKGLRDNLGLDRRPVAKSSDTWLGPLPKALSMGKWIPEGM